MGATDHMICSPFLYYFAPKSFNASINLPKGITVPTSHIVTVCLSNTLFLYNVLCVPTFSFNLLSISKLTKQSNLCLTFTASHCMLQHPSIKKMMGFFLRKQCWTCLPHLFSSTNQWSTTKSKYSTIQKNQQNWTHTNSPTGLLLW